jgi:hypothetical protein
VPILHQPGENARFESPQRLNETFWRASFLARGFTSQFDCFIFGKKMELAPCLTEFPIPASLGADNHSLELIAEARAKVCKQMRIVKLEIY